MFAGALDFSASGNDVDTTGMLMGSKELTTDLRGVPDGIDDERTILHESAIGPEVIQCDVVRGLCVPAAPLALLIAKAVAMSPSA